VSNRKGFVLLFTLVMTSIIAMIAMSLLSAVNTQTAIGGNNRRIMQAELAACSGLNHFIALNLTYGDLVRLSDAAPDKNLFVVIPEIVLSSHTSYSVSVRLLPTPDHAFSKKYIVESEGFYKKGDRVISSHVSKALYLGR